MGFIPQTTCRHCGKPYPGIRNHCPHCGTRRVQQSARTAPSTGSVKAGTSAASNALENTKWQFIFGIALLVAVVIAVIILINARLESETRPEDAVSTPPVSESVETPSPTPPPTPTPTPTPNVTSISVTYAGSPLANDEFSMRVDDLIQLQAQVFPASAEAVVTWRSSDEAVCTVDATGLVTGTGAGTASVIAECAGIAKQITVRVW